MSVANTLGYYDTEKITAVKCFTEHAPGAVFTTLHFLFNL